MRPEGDGAEVGVLPEDFEDPGVQRQGRGVGGSCHHGREGRSDLVRQLILNPGQQVVDVPVVAVKRAAADAGHGAELLDGDLVERGLAQQRQERGADAPQGGPGAGGLVGCGQWDPSSGEIASIIPAGCGRRNGAGGIFVDRAGILW